MKKTISIILAAVLALGCILGFAACSSGSKGITIAVPNDATNEARALLLLQEQGIIKLKDGAGITATIRDIEENPKNITSKEVEAAQLPNVLKDVDYAVINSNYAISAGLNPVKDNLAIEGSSSAYSNILAAKKRHREFRQDQGSLRCSPEQEASPISSPPSMTALLSALSRTPVTATIPPSTMTLSRVRR